MLKSLPLVPPNVILSANSVTGDVISQCEVILEQNGPLIHYGYCSYKTMWRHRHVRGGHHVMTRQKLKCLPRMARKPPEARTDQEGFFPIGFWKTMALTLWHSWLFRGKVAKRKGKPSNDTIGLFGRAETLEKHLQVNASGELPISFSGSPLCI